MTSCSNAQSSSPDGNVGLVQAIESPVKSGEDHVEGDDVDFDPSLKETLSPEASSSLSSEVQALDVVHSLEVMDGAKSTSPDRVEKEKVISFGTESSASDNQAHHGITVQSLENSHLENFQARDDEHNKASPFDEDDLVNEAGHDGGDLEEEDAICKRTRARYSLASFTLDELESFLQETDDDDDVQNVDDEREYRKFLAVVLQGNTGDGDHPVNHQVNENVDDEDEDNDADFEIELEEALDSDIDEKPQEKEKQTGSGRRPETRQNNNNRLKTSNEKNKLIMEPGKRPPLRPLLPLPPTIPNIPLSTSNNAVSVLPESARLTVLEDSVGFIPLQIFQLHCLIHEHVQLIIQTYSLCALEPSRQRVALQMQELIFEILNKRDQVLSWRNLPYPSHIFQPLSDAYLRNIQEQPPVAADSYINGTNGVTSSADQRQPENVCPSEGMLPAGPMESYLAMKGFHWVPTIRVPVLSILDVAPLKSVKTYFDEISTVVREFRRRNVESSCDMPSERVPLFSVSSMVEVSFDGANRGASSTDVLEKMPSSSSQPQKKTLAASLVETTKKQSIALVPKEVASSAQIFLPLFNQALFPHKPPPTAVTNRVLFTDAEDELLALGMMAYNTDWKAIQQRFLPCKSKHQIFVRQKNRCSAKAPDNPIKAVRRMKTSPLTMEELRYINEGLRIYKLDWMSVWKLIVPHRDPSLLPRQWRTATGTQKSYKQDPAKKERRRIYEADRRRKRSRAAANLPTWQQHGSEEDNQAGEENSSGDDCIDDPEEDAPYVHQAFLSDWRPGESGNSISSSSRIIANPHGSREASNLHQVPWTNRLHPPYLFPAAGHIEAAAASGPSMMPIRPQLAAPGRRRSKKTVATRLVKLAPNLPPVNLPQNVRILSNNSAAVSAHRSHHQSRVVSSGTRRVIMSGGTENTASSSHPNNGDDMNEDSRRVSVVQETHSNGVVGSSELLQQMMHPLLFQVPPVERLPYYQLNTATGTGSASCGGVATAFNFFSGQHHHVVHPPQLLLCHNTENNDVGGSGGCLRRRRSTNKSSRRVSDGIDFHPLLQRRVDDDDDSNLVNDSASAAAVEHTTILPTTNEEDESSSGGGFPSSLLVDSRSSQEVLDLAIQLSSTASELIPPPPQSHTPTATPVGDSMGSLLDRENTQSSNPAGMIVMEQEELSDSDEEEEIEDDDDGDEEHVEFECEEMDDSSSEGEAAEAPPEGGIGAVSAPPPGKDSETSSLDLWLPAKKKKNNKKSRTSWLSLDSSAAAAALQCQHDPTPSKTVGRRSSRSPATTTKNKKPSRKQPGKTTSSMGVARIVRSDSKPRCIL